MRLKGVGLLHHADHRKRLLLDFQHLADGIFVLEQMLDGLLIQNHNLPVGFIVGIQEIAAHGQPVAADWEIGGVYAVQGAAEVGGQTPDGQAVAFPAVEQG